jgi:hypothetical protein
MAKRLWIVLSVSWALMVIALQGEMSVRLMWVALFPLIAGPVLAAVARWVVRG